MFVEPPLTVMLTDTFTSRHHFHPDHFDLLRAMSSWSCFAAHNLTSQRPNLPIIEVDAKAVFHLRELPPNLTVAGVTSYSHGGCDPFKVGFAV